MSGAAVAADQSWANLHIIQRSDPPQTVQNKPPSLAQSVSEWRLFHLQSLRGLHFAAVSILLYFSCNNYHIALPASAFSVKTEHEGKVYNKQNKFYSILIWLSLSPVSFYHLMAYWLNQSLLWKMWIQEWCHIPSSWASLSGKSHKAGCKGTLGEIRYYMNRYYTGWKPC